MPTKRLCNRQARFNSSRILLRAIHQYILSHTRQFGSELKDIPIDDEAEERLAAFEEVDGHWQYKEAYY